MENPFSSVQGSIEDENTTKLLQHIASEAGFHTDFEYMHKVNFSDDGIFKEEENFEFWFKLVPWENIGIEESELALLLTDILNNQKAIIFNPAYTLMFQSKGFMKILWDLYPNHPLLLETSFEPLNNKNKLKKSALDEKELIPQLLTPMVLLILKKRENMQTTNPSSKSL